jgi:hypothetical protein
MSFRLFIYYCAVGGAWAALVGWYLGRQQGFQEVAAQAVKGFYLGLTVALALALLDALWNFSPRRLFQVVPRVVLAAVVGGAAGLVGGAVGQALYGRFQAKAFLVSGWAFTGLLVGASLGLFDVFATLLHPEGVRGAQRKVLNGSVGGLLGGLLGGGLSLTTATAMGRLFKDKDELRSPSALGFLVLGACLGLLIGLAQVLLKEAWVRVEAGFRPGRALILSRPEITIGRAESCDLGLFGDPSVERLHARIVQRGGRYVLLDAGTPAGTFVNERRITQPVALCSGDCIRVGRNVLRFRERHRRPAEANA